MLQGIDRGLDILQERYMHLFNTMMSHSVLLVKNKIE